MYRQQTGLSVLWFRGPLSNFVKLNRAHIRMARHAKNVLRTHADSVAPDQQKYPLLYIK